MPTHVNSSLTEDEIVRELEEAARKAENEHNQRFYRVAEFVEMMGWSDKKVRRALRALKADNRLEVGAKKFINLADQEQTATAYRILAPKDG